MRFLNGEKWIIVSNSMRFLKVRFLFDNGRMKN